MNAGEPIAAESTQFRAAWVTAELAGPAVNTAVVVIGLLVWLAATGQLDATSVACAFGLVALLSGRWLVPGLVRAYRRRGEALLIGPGGVRITTEKTSFFIPTHLIDGFEVRQWRASWWTESLYTNGYFLGTDVGLYMSVRLTDGRFVAIRAMERPRYGYRDETAPPILRYLSPAATLRGVLRLPKHDGIQVKRPSGRWRALTGIGSTFSWTESTDLELEALLMGRLRELGTPRPDSSTEPRALPVDPRTLDPHPAAHPKSQLVTVDGRRIDRRSFPVGHRITEEEMQLGLPPMPLTTTERLTRKALATARDARDRWDR